jgi:zinc transport system permease protein
MEDFIFRALLAAIGISIIAGSLGCFVIWRRMSYFSESISHSALLGVSLGLISGLDIHIGLIVVGVLFATLIVALQQKDFLSNDAILGIQALPKDTQQNTHQHKNSINPNNILIADRQNITKQQ